MKAIQSLQNTKAMTKTKYIVNVDYQTNSGNPATKRMVVSAWTDNEAIDVATARVRHLKTCMKVNGGSIESPVSSDFDWNAEVARLGEMREKAIAYLESTAKGNDDDIEFITSNGRGAVLYDTTDGFVLIQVGTDGPFYVSDMYEMDNLLSTCACVQKAIAERTVNP